jgi:hypothetical protein
MIAETCHKTEITATICGGNFRVKKSFRDHVRGGVMHVMNETHEAREQEGARGAVGAAR